MRCQVPNCLFQRGDVSGWDALFALCKERCHRSVRLTWLHTMVNLVAATEGEPVQKGHRAKTRKTESPLLDSRKDGGILPGPTVMAAGEGYTRSKLERRATIPGQRKCMSRSDMVLLQEAYIQGVGHPRCCGVIRRCHSTFEAPAWLAVQRRRRASAGHAVVSLRWPASASQWAAVEMISTAWCICLRKMDIVG